MAERRPLYAKGQEELSQWNRVATIAVAAGLLSLPSLISYSQEPPTLSKDFSCIAEYDPASTKLYASMNGRPGAPFFDYQLHTNFYISPIDINSPPDTTEINVDYATAITLQDFNEQAKRQGGGLLQAGEAVMLNFTVYANAGVYQGQGVVCQGRPAKL